VVFDIAGTSPSAGAGGSSAGGGNPMGAIQEGVVSILDVTTARVVVGSRGRLVTVPLSQLSAHPTRPGAWLWAPRHLAPLEEAPFLVGRPISPREGVDAPEEAMRGAREEAAGGTVGADGTWRKLLIPKSLVCRSARNRACCMLPGDDGGRGKSPW